MRTNWQEVLGIWLLGVIAVGVAAFAAFTADKSAYPLNPPTNTPSGWLAQPLPPQSQQRVNNTIKMYQRLMIPLCVEEGLSGEDFIVTAPYAFRGEMVVSSNNQQLLLEGFIITFCLQPSEASAPIISDEAIEKMASEAEKASQVASLREYGEYSSPPLPNISDQMVKAAYESLRTTYPTLEPLIAIIYLPSWLYSRPQA